MSTNEKPPRCDGCGKELPDAQKPFGFAACVSIAASVFFGPLGLLAGVAVRELVDDWRYLCEECKKPHWSDFLPDVE